MTQNRIDYHDLVDEAMHGVIYKVLSIVAEKGLPPTHHFYISFITKHKGVVLPPYLLDMYPHTMTIVLQRQFKDLTVSKEHFEVTLTFNGKEERIKIPIVAISSFSDPSVHFAIKLKDDTESDDFSLDLNYNITPYLITLGKRYEHDDIKMYEEDDDIWDEDGGDSDESENSEKPKVIDFSKFVKSDTKK